jgi:hypothetical protein
MLNLQGFFAICGPADAAIRESAGCGWPARAGVIWGMACYWLLVAGYWWKGDGRGQEGTLFCHERVL